MLKNHSNGSQLQTHFTDTEFRRSYGEIVVQNCETRQYLMCVDWLLQLSQCMVFPWTEPLHSLWEPHQVDSLDTHIHWNSGIQRPKKQTFIFDRGSKQQQIDQRVQCSVIVTKLKTSAEFGLDKALTMNKQQITGIFIDFIPKTLHAVWGPSASSLHE